MKKITLLLIGIMGLALLGVVHAAPLSLVNHTDVAMMTSDAPDASSTPSQLVSRGRRCICCWNTRRGVTRCKWMTRWRCSLRRGWCVE